MVGVGEASCDEVWRIPESLARGRKICATGTDRLGGGQVATALVALARLGLSTAFAGAVGDDATGALVLDGLRAERVDVSRAHVVSGGATRTALVIVDEDERTVIERVDHRVAVPPASLPEELIAGARVLHLDATQIATSLHAARIARAHDGLVSLDLDHPTPGIDELLALADLCVTSEGLPQELTGEQDFEKSLRALAERTPGIVVCTLGARGAAALDDGHLLFSPAFPIRVVDTTACGDTFRAALICALLDGKPLAAGIRYANAAASLKCRALGRRGCPTRVEIEGLLTRA